MTKFQYIQYMVGRNIAAIDPQMLTTVVNAMLVDLQVYQYLTVSHKG